jgi:Protein of unknown function (DUF2889)
VTEPSSWWEGHPELLPPDPDFEPLHRRTYEVRAWKRTEDTMLIRGAVMDLRPGGPIAERLNAAGGDDDGHPHLVHHMVVDLVVRCPDLTIIDAAVVFEAFPNPGCPSISTRYRDLIGLSIARGFTHQVRERFGGPRGCTHTTALLQAMGPVAVQCVFGMRGSLSPSDGPADRSAAVSHSAFMRDTCHVWAADGELWQSLATGGTFHQPLSMQNRLRESGLDPAQLDLSPKASRSSADE